MDRARAIGAWQEAAGPEVARHATGYAMRGTELVVFTDSPVWASELSTLSEHYRVAVNSALGREMVGSIRFTVSKRVKQEQQERALEEARARGTAAVPPVPLDEGEIADLEALADAIHDPGLRAAALRAAARDLEWKKGIRARKAPQASTGRATEGQNDL
jgi:hypothetical protein